jgi:hypothetical protein
LFTTFKGQKIGSMIFVRIDSQEWEPPNIDPNTPSPMSFYGLFLKME